ncbi:MAG TPA: histidine triad nucleotide-binding protein [Candidatus Sulfotelmatobacter sp.]|nr:histidine triad nucleotide-binding protein [Candidatus Sulfotelmatobacter sp.]
MPTAENCLFCKIVRKEIPAREEYRDEHVVAFHDVNPQAPVHVLVVPTDHAEHLSAFTGAAADGTAARLLYTASEIGRRLGPGGYRVVINEGPDAGQSVFHLHAHVLAGRPLGWPPG